VKIVLIGYRCTGKTSVGKIVSERFHLPFYDTDEVMFEQTGKTCKAIVDEQGWPAFRRFEKEIIRDLKSTQAVIAPGGGAVMDEENAAMLKENGLVVWLKADPLTIAQRLQKDTATSELRPSLTGNKDATAEIVEVLTVRTPVYQRHSDFTIDTTVLSIDEVASQLCAYLEERFPKG